MIKQPLEEWRQEARERFGELGRNWKFICPACQHVQTGKDFADKLDIELKEAANLVLQNCIGRHVKDEGCDWASYGFLGTLGKGRIIVEPNGEETEIFDFAPDVEDKNDYTF